MNILELNFERTWRGGERQTIYNMQGFRSAGMHVELVCRKGYQLEQKAIANSFKVHAFSNVFGVLLFLLTKGYRYRIFHVQTSHILTYCVLTKLFHRAKIIFTRRVDFPPGSSLSNLKYRFTDKIIAVSSAVKKVLEAYGLKNISVISDIAANREVNTIRAQALLNEYKGNAQHVIGTIAIMTEDKDPLTMVETIKYLSQQRNDFIFLHFGFGALENEVRKKIKEYGLSDIYHIIGYRENVEDYMSILDVFVMSSVHEGLGSSILDAFMQKVPVVATDAGGMAELLSEGRGGVCDTGSAAMLAEGINAVLENPELSSEMAGNAFQYVKQQHNMEYITNAYMELFRQLS